jgi:hypothetical protein
LYYSGGDVGGFVVVGDGGEGCAGLEAFEEHDALGFVGFEEAADAPAVIEAEGGYFAG